MHEAPFTSTALSDVVGDQPEPRKKSTGRPPSWVHGHGVRMGDKIRCVVLVKRVLEDRTLKECECGAEFQYVSTKSKGSSTSGFKKHLMEVHAFNKDGERLGGQHTLKQEANGSMAVFTTALKDKRTQNLGTDIESLIAFGGLPISFVENPAWKEFAKRCWPSFPGIGRAGVAAVMERMEKSFYKFAVEFLPKCGYYGLTSDGWKSDANEKYRNLCLHFWLPGTWETASMILQIGLCGGKAPAIAQFMRDVMNKVQLPQGNCVAVVTDTASAEKAGQELVGLYRGDCADHVLELAMRRLQFDGKPAVLGPNGAVVKDAVIGSPVANLLGRVVSFAKKMHASPNLKLAFEAAMDAHLATTVANYSATKRPALPTFPNNTRWFYIFFTLRTTCPLRRIVDQVLNVQADYELSTFSESDWKILFQLKDFLGHFHKVSEWAEGELYPTSAEFFGYLLQACMNTFYNHNYMALLLTPVRTAVTMVRKDLAQRLWNGSFDIPIVGMLLHPYLHRCEAPNGMTHQQLLEDDGRGIAKFFFSDFLQRGTAAFWRVVERLGIHQDDVQNAVPEQQGAPAPRRFSFVPSSLAVVNGNFQTPQAELAAFLETSEIASLFYAKLRVQFLLFQSLLLLLNVRGLLQMISRGGDRASISPEALNRGVLLKKNAKVLERIKNCSLFQAYE